MVWVTGANGMLGRRVVALLEAGGVSSVRTDLELDIADPEQVTVFARTHRPTLLVNCAAYTAVDAAESDRSGAHRANALGPRVLSDVCRELGSDIIHFSTDYVFGGRGDVPYVENAPLAPCNVYGATKAEGEVLLERAFSASDAGTAPRWWILRTSWLFGAGRSSFVDTMWNLMKTKQELKVVADQRGRPTYVNDLADTALSLAGIIGKRQPAPSGVWHFANHGATTWYDFACAIRQELVEAGEVLQTERILPISTAEFPRPAPRPAYSVLDTTRIEREAGILPRPWQAALKEYVRERSRLNRGDA